MRVLNRRGLIALSAGSALVICPNTRALDAQAPTGSLVASDSEIRAALVRRVGAEQQSVGIVVGIVEPAGRRIIAYGRLGANDPRPVDGNTLYEIGSISKVFTSLLLADMMRHGEVALDEPLQELMPAGVSVPSRDGRQITLVDLATHTSALPPMPTNFAPRDAARPYVDYTDRNLLDFVSSAQLTREIGSQFEYSNLGAGLLGFALARQAHADYEALIRSRIVDPLGMSSTRIALTQEMAERFAAGHDARMHPVPHWDFAALAAAGAWRSTANDLLTFLAANIGLAPSPLDSAMAAMRRVSRPGPAPQIHMGLAWFVGVAGHPNYVFHGGTTAGFQTFIAFDPDRRIGVVVLSNAGTPVGVEDIGLHLLDKQVPLFHPPPLREHKEIAIDSMLLARYVGRYELAPNVILTITRHGASLFGQVTGQGRIELFAEAEREFFAKITDLQFTFEIDGRGSVVAAVQHQLGITQRWRRIE